ncbi:MAG: RHS repeat-associated core domain-containing protein [Gammaproteobacteria bacterium]|nr:MAG: RHS repeat-associated core domain-containing protein [Gammaproteobacteria bacterium]
MSGSPHGLYRYNARGERLIKQSGFMNFGLKERVSSYDEQGKLVAYLDYEYDNRGRRLLKGSYDLVYLDDLPVAMLSKGKISYLETDHLGTPRLAVDSVTHAEQWSWDFFADAFGANDAIVNDGKVDLPLRYPGQQYDSESGLHYNYFRDYEPGTGRYMESDPIGLRGGVATFAYGLGNPTKFYDSTGLAVCSNCDKSKTPPFGIWISSELGGNAWGVVSGASAALGATTNILTGESCFYSIRCGYVGLGWGAGVGFQGGITFSKAACGISLHGLAIAGTAELTTPRGGVSVSGSYDTNAGGLGSGIGPTLGVNANIGLGGCFVHVFGCANTPCYCS